MGKGVATMPRVFLGEALRQLRADSGHSLEVVAAHIGKSRQRVMTLLEGRATLTAEELTSVATFLGAGGERLRELEALGAEARKPPTGDPYTDLGPESWRRVAYLEAKATTIQSYENGVFPALIQSADYAEALIKATEGIWQDPLDDHVRTNRAAFRLSRQSHVYESAEHKTVRLFFTEDTFNAPVGTRRVMWTQCLHMLDLANRFAHLEVRIVPTPTWDNPAQNGALALFGFGELIRPIGFLPVLYGPSTYLDTPEDTARMARAFDRLSNLALPQDESLAMIAARLEGFGT
ncbi:helix-turn-helix transcriptional regulator [Actinokineospora sp. NBRC 105648]|uniref:helix-turn-helix domain-containing protein n=1 Tax=Actinokineospora sp. NBRC 105648 TaxID=3032206 RepID=UPI0024A49D28|nr:helix-turn-helix transcriptional regulator [Actinokineospora sp. NBRC 105648]GLZ41182.1 hypothetical protein Acsp05_48060 [Actinokineospora sp. NBRC 105648]